jgi:prevent-host-death family protein
VGDQERVTQTVDVAEAREQFDSLVDRVATGRTRVVVQDHGRTVAALISEADLERLEALDRRAAEGWKVIEELHARFAHLDPEEVERDILEEVEAMRAEARAKNRSAAPSTPRT